jgi:hypothetical protein
MSERGTLHGLSKIALAGAVLALLGACDTFEALMAPAAETAAAQEQAPAAKAASSIETAPLAPVALASGLGPSSLPAPTPQPKPEAPAKPAVAAPPEPPPAAKPAFAVAAATPPEPAIDGVAVASPPVNCPSGTIGMWSQPDIIGSAVYICRALNRPR